MVNGQLGMKTAKKNKKSITKKEKKLVNGTIILKQVRKKVLFPI